MQGVLEEAIPRREGVVRAPKDGAVGEGEPLEQVEIVAADGVADVDGAAGDGAGGGVERRAGVGGLEHVPVGVDELAHPKRVVGAVNHVASLQPVCPVRVTRWVRAPKVVACNKF